MKTVIKFTLKPSDFKNFRSSVIAKFGFENKLLSVTQPGESESNQNVDGSYFDAFKKEDLRELLAQCTASWLLSPDYR